MTSKWIVVGYDQSPDARAAAAWALDEAERTGAGVEFLFAYEWPTWLPATAAMPSPAVWPDGETDRAVRGALNEAVAQAKDQHPSVRTRVTIVSESAAVTLLDRSADAALIVLGSRGHSNVAGLLGSVSVAVSAHAKCPVVVVRGDAGKDAPVVVGLDDSPAAQRALAFAAEEAVARRAPLRVIRAWAPPAGPWQGTPLDGGDLVAAWQEKYPDLAITAETVTVHPAAALTEAAATAQLLVVGTRGRGPVRGMVVGSVSQHLLRHAACTVAVVHDRG